MSLEAYHAKRDFGRTPEPRGRRGRRAREQALSFVVQKHAARRLHYDFRLELDGVLLSWAVPKGPSLDPAEKRLAVHTEDHPLDYGGFEGVIPKGEYGGGTVLLWDRGTWTPEGDPREGHGRGRLSFRLEGARMRGGWHLVRAGGRGRPQGPGKEEWLLIKADDEWARPGRGDALVASERLSVSSGRTMEQIAAERDRVWSGRDGEVGGGPSSESGGEAPSALDPGSLPGASRASLFRPALQLARLAHEAPVGPGWVHEVKHDGYRVLATLDEGQVRCTSRGGHDWTGRALAFAPTLRRLSARSALIDGEAVALLADGRSSFQALQDALARGREAELVYYAFDLLYLDGYDLRAAPLSERKRLLRALLETVPGVVPAPGSGSGALGGGAQGPVRLSEHLDVDGPEFFQHACRLGLEGIISKRADAVYRGGRSGAWLKVKCRCRAPFVVAGYTAPQGSRAGFGALVLAEPADEGPPGSLRYVGKVGTGFDATTLGAVHGQLRALERASSPLAEVPRELRRRTTWVTPQLRAQVSFVERTTDGRLRLPVFEGLVDEPARAAEGTRTSRDAAPPAVASTDQATPGAEPARARSEAMSDSSQTRGTQRAKPAARRRSGRSSPRGDAVQVAGVRISSPDKVLYPEQGVTKRELAEYYATVADWILPYLRERPLTLVRCPEGHHKQCFYQKHANRMVSQAVKRVEISRSKQEQPYLYVDDLQGLLTLVQLGALELHIWNGRVQDVTRADQLVFDLDPDVGLPWERVVEAARDVQRELEDLGLATFLKTTGGKGLHVVVPLRGDPTWEQVKAFAHEVVKRIARRAPERYTTALPKAQRKGKLFLDYLRNQWNATAIAPYSGRARPGATVAVPLRWDELSASLDPSKYDIRSVPRRLSALKADPWAAYEQSRRPLPTL